jgi:serine/threonine-protein kinase RsbW
VSPKAPQTDSAGPWIRKVLPTELERIREPQHEVLARMRDLGYDEDHRFAVRLALEEALVNAMKHGNKMDPSRCVRVEYRVLPAQVEIRVADEGEGFDPGRVPDPTCDENLAKPCGRGIMLMRCYMDEVAYAGNGREVHMVKYRRT